MQDKQVGGFFLIIFAALAVLGILSAIAIPNVGRMIDKSRVAARATEFHNIQTAVTEMLYDSACRALEPVGPTADMRLVRTRDAAPLVLADYLFNVRGNPLKSGCTYEFTADGTVVQIMP
jgi:type II secretory pathway pseudopilin PulG